jgi:pimeloyl-ACP methyl ester carboxylesterase
MIETLQLPPVAEQKLPQGVFDSISSMMLNDSDWIEGPSGLVLYGATNTNDPEAVDIVVPAEFGNGLDKFTANRLAARAFAFAASGLVIRNIILLPAPGRSPGHYPGEVGKDNPLGDLAQSYSDMLNPILGERSVVIYGCSQGAAIAPHLAKQLPEGSCSHLVALEPPNVVNRGRIALFRAMGQHPDWKTQAMAGLPDNFRQNLIGPGSNTSFFLGALTAANHGLTGPNGMGSYGFAKTISGLPDGIQTLVASASDSAISPSEIMRGLVLPNGLIRVIFSPSDGETLGHPVTNNLIVAHELGKIAGRAPR